MRDKIKDKIWSILNNKWGRIIHILILVFIELFFLLMLNDKISSSYWCYLALVFGVWSAIFILGFSKDKKAAPYGFRNQSIQKLLVGSIAKSNLYSIFVLFVFLCQLTWCMDIGGKLFVEWKWGGEEFVGFMSSIFVLFAIGLMFSFPPKAECQNQDRKLLLSGFSAAKSISYNNIELAVKPIVQFPCQIEQYGNDNVKREPFGIQSWFILPSTSLFALQLDRCDIVDKLRETNVSAAIIRDEDISDLEKEIEAYNSQPNKDGLAHFLKTYLKVVHQKDNVDINFFKAVDYNDFECCYNEASKILDFEKKYQKSNKNVSSYTVVHTSPGTAAVSAVMSTLAIKLDRQLVYTEQGGASRLLTVGIDVLTLKDFFDELSNDME